MQRSRYKPKNILIASAMLTPVMVIVNILLFGTRYFTDVRVFFPATVVTFVIIAIAWQLHTLVAATLRNRLPKDEQLYKRVFITILILLLMTSLNITLIFWGYDYVGFLGYKLDENMYKWALIITAIENIFVTFLHEGVSSFEKWKNTLKETEQLKKEYLQSQLLGLKSQVNPHFLFNSLNSLSSLISEDREEAEKFLNEMSKVYRYLLRSNDDQLVDLQTELDFIQSYIHLLKARYGDGIRVSIEVAEEEKHLQLPPFTFQMIFENILSLNRTGKDFPLMINMKTCCGGWMEITNNIQKKLKENVEKEESALVNIANKFRLLCNKNIAIEETPTYRLIRLPLISHMETVSL